MALLLGFAIIVAPLMALGGLLLRKYDNDKIKQKEGYVKQPLSLRKSPILKGIIIGIIASLIIWGTLLAATNQTFVMSGDAMSPTINELDLMRYVETPFQEIKRDDIIIYTDLENPSKRWVHKVIEQINPFTLRVSSEASPTLHTVTAEQYIGKVDSIIPDGGKILRIANTPYNIIIFIAAFVIPIIIMKTLERKPKNS